MGTAWQEGALSLSSTVTTYLDAYSRYIARHISVHPGVFEPGSALRILGNPNEQRTPLAFQTFAVLANGKCLKFQNFWGLRNGKGPNHKHVMFGSSHFIH